MIAQAVNDAIKTAKASLGDLVKGATLRKSTGRTYDTGTGKYTHTYNDMSIDYVPDKFSFQEMQAEDFVQTDVKILVFNPTNTLEFTTDDAIVMNGEQFAIRKSDPTFIGGFKAVFTLVLRK